jgi:hypothetical protein
MNLVRKISIISFPIRPRVSWRGRIAILRQEEDGYHRRKILGRRSGIYYIPIQYYGHITLLITIVPDHTLSGCTQVKPKTRDELKI